MKSYHIKNVFYIAFLFLICFFIFAIVSIFFRRRHHTMEGLRSLKSIGKSIENTAKKATSSVASAAKPIEAAAKPIAAAAKPIEAAVKPIAAAAKPIASMAKTALTPKSVKDNSKDSGDTNEDTNTKTPAPASSQVFVPGPIPTEFDPNLLKEMSPENIVKTIVKQLYEIRNLSNKITEINTKTK